MLLLSCFCYASMRICLLMFCGHLLGKGWPLGSRLWCPIVKLSLSHWHPWSDVLLDCIDSWNLPFFIYVKHVTLGWAHFWPQGNNLNKFRRGPLGDATCLPNIKALGLVLSDKKMSSCFSCIIGLCKTYDTWVWTMFGRRSIIWTNSVKCF